MKRAMWILMLTGVMINLAFGGGKSSKLTEDKFVDLYVQLSIAAEKFLSDSVKLAQTQDSIFSAFGTTREEFDNFRKKLDEKPEKWEGIWKKIVEKLNQLDQESKKQKSNAQQDTKTPEDTGKNK